MALSPDDVNPEVLLQDEGAGPPPLTPAAAAGMLKAWLEDHRGAADAQFVCRVAGDVIEITHREASTFRAATGDA